MQVLQKIRATALFGSVALCLAACGGGSSSSGGMGSQSSGGQTTYTVTVDVTNLNAGTSFEVQNNGGDNLTIQNNGNYAFSASLNNGTSYDVTVLTEPQYQTCLVSGAYQGTSSTNVTVRIDCSQALYPVGGTVSGLTGSQTVQLQIDNQDTTQIIEDYTVSTNGAFLFGNGTYAFTNGTPYTISVVTQPLGGTCTVIDMTTGTASGTISGASSTELKVTCS